MSEGIPYADIIILALVAGFILLRLRSVLGQKIGNDNPDFFKKNKPDELERDTIIRPSEKQPKPKMKEEAVQDSYLQSAPESPTVETLKAIKAKDSEFSATEFLQGAKMAFEMIFEGFSKADRAPLKMLLSEALFKQFDAELEARAKEESKTETTLVSVTAREISRAELSGSTARLTVNFTSEQITVVRDKDHKIIEGDPSEVLEVLDEWTFERDITSRNPNWKIIDT
jgi:predicted lipid-binding transport protein (Tim44 family)